MCSSRVFRSNAGGAAFSPEAAAVARAAKATKKPKDRRLTVVNRKQQLPKPFRRCGDRPNPKNSRLPDRQYRTRSENFQTRRELLSTVEERKGLGLELAEDLPRPASP